MMDKKRLSILVPTLNEAGNIAELIRRLDASIRGAGIEYEIHVIDDHSSDGTTDQIEKLKNQFPVFLHVKKGRPGKAFSILEGFEHARFEMIAMIDADLQYPPEAIPAMVQKLSEGLDIVVANRVERETSFVRKLSSRGFAFVFSKLLHGFDVDVQSGLKVFRSTIAREVRIAPDPWTFDLEFLRTARHYGYHIGGHDITFSERMAGESKIVLGKAIREIGWNAIRLRFRSLLPFHIMPAEQGNSGRSMIGAGVLHARKRFITHSTLSHEFSALHTFLLWQKALLFLLVFLFVGGLVFFPLGTLITVTAILTGIYFFDVLFNLFFVSRSLKKPPEISFTKEELALISDDSLPTYSVLCPLYREAHVLPGFLEAIEKMEWPKEKLEALLLLEENDRETIEAARAMALPSFVKIVVVPHSEPKTKPKACNYGLSVATGEYVVIYDAEDIPDPAQLKKAYLGFQTLPRTVWCLQAKLNYFNVDQNILTRLFTAEYSLWFDVMLPALQSVSTSIPLGGTSNHFRREDLLALEGWDPFNVTEDCDLGARIFTRGFRTAIIDSVTLEEANSKVGNWIRQRSRWIKGYMQTYLVHMRRPGEFFRKNGVHALLFQFIVGGKIAFMLINPILWIETILYFTFRDSVGGAIESLYPSVVFYMAVVSLVFGNFLAMYYYMIGCAKREKWSLMKWVFLIPFYWLLVSLAAMMAAYQLLVKPHYWEKTTHGLHLLKKKRKESVADLPPSPDPLSQRDPSLSPILSQNILSPERISEVAPVSSSPTFLLRSFQKMLRLLTSPEGFFAMAIIATSVLNFTFSAFLGRTLPFEALGAVALLNTLWYLALIFISPFSTMINRETSFLSAKCGAKEARTLWASVLRTGLIVSIFLSALWLFLVPTLARFFHVDDLFLLISFAPLLSLGLFSFGNFGFLQGSLRFRAAGVISFVEALTKLLVAFLFVTFGYAEFAYLSIPASVFVAAVASGFFIPSVSRALLFEKSREAFPFTFFVAALLLTLSTATFTTVDVLLAKHFLPEYDAGRYALLSLVGKIVFFFGTMPNMFMMTLVGRNKGLKKGTRYVFRILYAFSMAACILGVLLFGLFGEFFAPFLFGEKVREVAPLLLISTLSAAFFTLSTLIVTYQLAKKKYIFVGVSLLVAIGEVMSIVFFHDSLEAVAHAVFFSGLVGWGILELLHLFEPQFRFLERGVRDFLDAFRGKIPELSPLTGGKRVLIVNWRDTKHQHGGGAEVYIEEMAKRWVADGHFVTLFSGNDGRLPRHEIRDGIHIVRRGGFYLVYVWAFVYYFTRFRGRYDVIIDCENGIPFFTPLYVKEPVVCLLHHVHRTIFFQYLPKPFAHLANFLEGTLMPIVYANVPFVTVSESSREDLLALGLGKAGVSIVHPGVLLDEFVPSERKSETPLILYLGRLKAYKSVDILLRAFHQVRSERPEARLVIAGNGDEEQALKYLAYEELRLGTNHVEFLGYVSEEIKKRLLREAWMLVNPSKMEGWGIVSIEANACGTPVIASDVPGLRDSVNTQSGFLIPYGDVDLFAEKMLLLIRDRELRLGMNREAREWAEGFDWDVSSKQLFSAVFAKHNEV
ncbi:MAG: glycosyltransferase [Candidatus Moraniibacteriota bacterium]|nr:MAG: glycosyltransferase [Candidatus Moranbacteria bacterium]